MKLHWSVKRGRIIVKTYKEHLLTIYIYIYICINNPAIYALHPSNTRGLRDAGAKRSSSSRILMSHQPHRITSGQSGHKQIHISKLLYIYQPSVKSINKANHFANIKHKHQTQIFEELVPFNINPVKRAHKGRSIIKFTGSRLKKNIEERNGQKPERLHNVI